MSRIIVLIFVCVSWVVHAQDVTIINNYNSDPAEMSQENFVLKSVTEHTYIINEYEPANTGERSRLQQMISYGLRSHVDNEMHVYDGRVEALENVLDFEIATNAIVQNAIWIHDMPFYNDFLGFSDQVMGQMSAINKVDGAEVMTGEQDRRESSNGKIGLYTFQRMVYELKKNMETEVNAFLDIHLPRTEQKNYNDPPSNYLANQNFQLSSFDGNQQDLLEVEPEMDFPAKKENRRSRKNRKGNQGLQFSERIVELLEENNKILANYDNRFEDIQNQIDDIKTGQPKQADTSVKSEIAELRQMIVDLSNGKSVQEIDGSTTSIATESLTIVFEKNAFELSIGHQAKLNRAVGELKSHPRYTALITGYADKTGDPEFNAWISKARADSVKDYLLAKGVSDQRLILNFLGDEESDYSNPADRKVEIQFLQNSSSLN